MKYRIRCNGKVIAETDFGGEDRGMSVAIGRWRPMPAYEEVRAIFQALADAEPAYQSAPVDERRLLECRARVEALTLSLESADGTRIETGWIDLRDYSQIAGDEGRDVSAHVTDLTFPWSSSGES